MKKGIVFYWLTRLRGGRPKRIRRDAGKEVDEDTMKGDEKIEKNTYGVPLEGSMRRLQGPLRLGKIKGREGGLLEARGANIQKRAEEDQSGKRRVALLIKKKKGDWQERGWNG